jgi:hypothetical protein
MEPVLVKCLRLLRDSSELLTDTDIAERTGEDRVFVESALQKLRGKNILAKIGEGYHYQKTLINEEFSEKMLAIYEKVSRKSKGELVVVGILSTAARYKYLVDQSSLLRILEEDFDSGQLKSFLEEEYKKGSVGRLKVVIRTRENIQLPFPPVIPFRYVPPYRMNLDDYERIKKAWLEEGFCVQEGDYLMANFPSDMADPAKEYLDKEMPHIRQKIKKQAFKFWYGLGLPEPL